MELADLHDLALTDDATLEQALETLLAPVVRRQLWVLLLDDRDVLMSPLLPNDDFPRSPHERVDGDPRTAVQAYADCFAEVVQEVGVAQLVLVWERPGRGPLDPDTRAWARELHARFGDAGVRVRAQCHLSAKGLRMLRPDDLL